MNAQRLARLDIRVEEGARGGVEFTFRFGVLSLRWFVERWQVMALLAAIVNGRTDWVIPVEFTGGVVGVKGYSRGEGIIDSDSISLEWEWKND